MFSFSIKGTKRRERYPGAALGAVHGREGGGGETVLGTPPWGRGGAGGGLRTAEAAAGGGDRGEGGTAVWGCIGVWCVMGDWERWG